MGRKLVALVLTMVLSLIVLMPAAQAASTTYVTLPSTMGGLIVRAGAGTNYDIAGWAVDGDEIELLKAGSSWSKIKVLRSGKSGYIRNSFIEDLGSGGTGTPSTGGTATAGRVTGRSVHLRKGAGTGYASIGAVPSGTKLKIWRTSGSWHYATTLGGKTGWIYKSYVASGYTMLTSARVNLRASANGSVIKSLAKGTLVNVQSITGSWSKVKVGKTTGYVYNQYLK